MKDTKVEKYCRSMIRQCPKPLLQRAQHLELAIVDRKYAKGTTASYERLNRNLIKAIGNYERAFCGLDRYLSEALWLEEL